MFKKKYSYLNKDYNTHLYSGLIGKLMKINHNLMEKNNNLFDENTKILEIGAGTYPHINHIKHKFKSYDIIDIDEGNMLKEYYKKNNFDIEFTKYDGIKIPFNDKKFDRIIISHCLEHISKPEIYLDEVIRVMNDQCILSISLPTDPGILWRLCRYITKNFIQKKSYNLKNEEYDYINAIEHVNSIFNLETILNNKLTKISRINFPTFLPFHDINIFYIADYKK